MRAQKKTRGFEAAAPFRPTQPSGLLQRKCACGGAAGLAGACGACGSRRLSGGGAEARTTAPLNELLLGPRFGHSLARIAVRAGRAGDSELREESLDWQRWPDGGGGAEPLEGDAMQGGSPPPVVLPGIQSGGTTCDLDTGTAVMNVVNQHPCTTGCSAQHEQQHADDIGPCCRKASDAYKKAETQAGKDAVRDRYNEWTNANTPFLECRAYAVSIKCAEAARKARNCEQAPNADKCCGPLTRYLASSRMQKDAACNQVGKGVKALTDCPF